MYQSIIKFKTKSKYYLNGLAFSFYQRNIYIQNHVMAPKSRNDTVKPKAYWLKKKKKEKKQGP